MRGRRVPASAVFWLAAAWLFFESLILGPFSYIEIHDAGDDSIPRCLTLASDRFSPRSGLWLPWMACGTDRLSQSMSLTLLSTLVFLALPGWLAYPFLLVGQFFCCAYFTYRLARDRLDAGEDGAILGGLAAGFLTDGTLGYQSAFTLLPFMIWALEKASEKPGASAWGLAFILGLLSGACSSVASSLPFCLAAGALWFAFARSLRSLRFWGLFLLFCCASTLPHLQTAWALMLNAGSSHRAAWTPVGSAPDRLGRILESALGLGLPLAVGLAGFAFKKGRDARLWILLGCVLALVAGAEALEALKAHAHGSLGFLRGYNAGRLSKCATVFAALFAARGFDFLPARRWVFFAAAGVLFAASVKAKAARIPDWIFQGGYTANYASPVLRELGARREEPFRVATFTHALHPAYANLYGLESVDGYPNLYPRAYQSFWAKVIEPMAAHAPGFRENRAEWGNRIYLFFDDAERFPEGIPFSRFYRLNLLSLANAKYLISRVPLLDPALEPIHVPPPWPGSDRRARLGLRLRENFSGKTHLYVYENKSVLPRAFLAGGARFFPDERRLLEELAAAEGRKIRDAVFLDQAFRGAVGLGPFSTGKASIEQYRSDGLAVRVETDGPALLVVTNNFSPYWTCSAEGAARAIMPAYGVFWALRLEAGDKKVACRYAPPYRAFWN